jgi:hypothetical protein
MVSLFPLMHYNENSKTKIKRKHKKMWGACAKKIEAHIKKKKKKTSSCELAKLGWHTPLQFYLLKGERFYFYFF